MFSFVIFKIFEDIVKDLFGSEIFFLIFFDIIFQVWMVFKDFNLSVEQLVCLIGVELLMSIKIICMFNLVVLNFFGCEIVDVKNVIIWVGMELVCMVLFVVVME